MCAQFLKGKLALLQFLPNGRNILRATRYSRRLLAKILIDNSTRGTLSELTMLVKIHINIPLMLCLIPHQPKQDKDWLQLET